MGHAILSLNDVVEFHNAVLYKLASDDFLSCLTLYVISVRSHDRIRVMPDADGELFNSG